MKSIEIVATIKAALISTWNAALSRPRTIKIENDQKFT